MKKLGIYIHIPFCTSKCKYCGFYSLADSRNESHELYVEELIEDIIEYGKEYGTDYLVDTVFIGGGTPSVLHENLIERIMKALKESFEISPDSEITIETNPKTLTMNKLCAYKKSGINRLSMGVQSFDNIMLEGLGRIHKAEDVFQNFHLAREAGFDNINLDLMFGIPGQTMEIWLDTLKQVVELEPEHISFYSLQIEEGTPFYDMYKNGTLDEVTDEVDRQMYHEAIKDLALAGYEHYEISNCAKAGRECKHNLKYWSMDDYLGIGHGASSFIGGVRFAEAPNLEYNINSFMDDVGEFVFTGLRKREGISLEQFRQKFGKELWSVFSREVFNEQSFFEAGLVEEVDGFFRLTEAGIDVSNEIMAEFV